MTETMRVGCIGIGVMGGALMKAVCRVIAPSLLIVSDNDSAKAEAFAAASGCLAAASNTEVLQAADIVFLAVKPSYLPGVLEEIAGGKAGQKLFISLAAGVTLPVLTGHLGRDAKIIRIMPNLPAITGEAMIGLAALSSVSAEEVETVVHLLSKAGLTEVIPESLMDGVTAVSGSGPAYGFLFIEALADAAVKFGIPRRQALRYAAQTLKGAASMVLETGEHPAVLKDRICSPAGTTIEAVRVLEECGFRSAVIRAAEAAYLRSKELAAE